MVYPFMLVLLFLMEVFDLISRVADKAVLIIKKQLVYILFLAVKILS